MRIFWKIVRLLCLPAVLAACGGGSGTGQIDFSSPTVVEDLKVQLSAIDPSVMVEAHSDGTIVLTKGADKIVIQPGITSDATIEFSGQFYSVNIDPTGKYSFSPSINPLSTDAYVASVKSMFQDLSEVGDKLGLDPDTDLVDLTLGIKNELSTVAPNSITMNAVGTASVTGNIDGEISVSGNIDMSQNMKITHNLTDSSVIAAQKAGWDGTGVNLTVLDFLSSYGDYTITQTGTATVTATDGDTTETETLTLDDETTLRISHSTLVSGIATGLDWQTSLEEFYGSPLDDDCSISSGVIDFQDLEVITFTRTSSVTTNHCDKIGIATGANAISLDEANVDWEELIEDKNATSGLEILNYSFASNRINSLNFTDNHNVVIVHAAGNESEPNNGYDTYGDGRKVDGSVDAMELMELSLIESDFADNLISVGALDSNDSIAVYSSIAGSDYDGSSYAFLVDDGTVSIEFDKSTSLSGDISFSNDGRTISGILSGNITENLTISIQGTSYAAPRVSGKVAIASQKFPNLNAEQLVNLAKHTAIDLGAAGVDRIYGHGKINLTGMLSPIGRLN